MSIPTTTQFISETHFAAETRQQYMQTAAGPLSSMKGFIAFAKIPPILREIPGLKWNMSATAVLVPTAPASAS